MTSVCVAGVLTFYLWLASLGTWTRWPHSTSWYGALASAFLHGQLSLLEEPEPALLALPDPYDPAQLARAQYPLDFSLYAGKFYLYIGPVPALLLAPAQYLLRAEISDAYPGFAFIFGLFIVQSLLLLKIWRGFFRDVSLWALAGSVLVIGLAVPSAWLLVGSHWSSVAVMGGAFFFMAGFAAALSALTSEVASRPRLLLAGALWAAAVGTRITQVVSVALLSLLVCGAIIASERRAGNALSAMRSMLALGFPLLLGAAGLGWYNWARFGSPLETGLRYQLNPQFMARLFRPESGELFSPLYVVQNLSNYLFRPPGPHGIFPFVNLQPAWKDSVISALPLPASYHPEWMTGLLWAAPFVVFAAWSLSPALHGSIPRPENQRIPLGWIITALWTAFLTGFAVIMPFFWSGERYLADFVAPLYLLSAIGFWQCGRSLSGNLRRRVVFVLLAVGLIGATILVSNLLAISQNEVGFRSLNPGAWEQMVRLSGGDLRRWNPELWAQLRAVFGL